VKNSAG